MLNVAAGFVLSRLPLQVMAMGNPGGVPYQEPPGQHASRGDSINQLRYHYTQESGPSTPASLVLRRRRGLPPITTGAEKHQYQKLAQGPQVRRYAHLSPSVNAHYAAEIDRELELGSNSRRGRI